jgi:hypothetical protein
MSDSDKPDSDKPDSDKKDKQDRMPYEPPALFDLGGGVAHAAGECLPGGSPSGGLCAEGSALDVAKCGSGGLAGSQCQSGTAAFGGKCQVGESAAGRCSSGGAPT